MTKTIEFVEEEIENLKSMLKLDDVLCELSDEDYKWANDRLQTLEQIKAELEAWNLAKTGIYEGTEITGKYHDKAIKIDRRVYVEGTEQYKTFKKALEVEDEKILR